MKKSLILILLFAFITAFSQPVTLKWERKVAGVKFRGEKTFDETYGFGPEKVNAYKFGVDNGAVILEGKDSYVFLSNPIFGTEGNQSFQDILPLPLPYPPKSIQNGRPWNLYPDSIPPYREHYYIARKQYGAGWIQYNLYYRNAEDAWIWDYFGVTEWIKKYPPEVEMIPNPAWFVVDSINQQRKIDYYNVLQANLVMMGYFAFPVIPDGEGVKWFIKNPDRTYTEIPVEVGKYTARNKWVAFYDPDHMQWAGAVQRTFLWADRNKIVKTLVKY